MNYSKFRNWLNKKLKKPRILKYDPGKNVMEEKKYCGKIDSRCKKIGENYVKNINGVKGN